MTLPKRKAGRFPFWVASEKRGFDSRQLHTHTIFSSFADWKVDFHSLRHPPTFPGQGLVLHERRRTFANNAKKGTCLTIAGNMPSTLRFTGLAKLREKLGTRAHEFQQTKASSRLLECLVKRAASEKSQ